MHCFVKLDLPGNSLPDSATSWAMVKDILTGLIWEGKTSDGSIHDKNNTYNWNDAQDVFIKDLNATKFFGFADWRLPTLQELFSILDMGKYNPAIDPTFFPNCFPSRYWSSTPCASYSGYTWSVDFYDGGVSYDYKSRLHNIRAVCNEQF